MATLIDALKNEVQGMTSAMSAALRALQEQTSMAAGQHLAYRAASQRAEASETQVAKLLQRVRTLEDELEKHKEADREEKKF